MTCIFYSGESLSADSRIVLPTSPSAVRDGGEKLFVAKSKQFAYAYSGAIPDFSEETVALREKTLHTILVALSRRRFIDRGPLHAVVPGFDDLSQKARKITFFASMLLVTKGMAFSISENVDSMLRDLFGDGDSASRSILSATAREAVRSPWVYPHQGVLAGHGTGAYFAMGAYAGSKETDHTKRLEETFRVAAEFDPMTNQRVYTVHQSDLLPLIVE